MGVIRNGRKLNFSQGGFTLIELLVVIGVIGILVAVILASLSLRRGIKGQMHQ